MAVNRSHSLRAKLAALLLGWATLAAGRSPIYEMKLHEISAFRTVDLASFAGKPLLLSFFQPDCPPCRTELLKLKALKENNSSLNMIAVGIGDTAALAAELRPLKLNFPAVESTPRLERAVGGVTKTPFTITLDESKSR